MTALRPLRVAAAALLALGVAAAAPAAHAFCGFFVAKADGELFNEASKVVLARDGDRTVITMLNDYRGDPQDFALVTPTPAVLTREQINVVDPGVIAHLDAYTAPRLVEYHDGDPCRPPVLRGNATLSMLSAVGEVAGGAAERGRALGVTIEAQYTVGEYDILILSAKESDGLQTWLDENGYKTPEKARRVLGSYIAQGMKFFVARVNLAERAKTGAEFLRPLQIAFDSPKFMLPIRLGTVNAAGEQDMLVFALTRTGRVETSNYRTARIPSNIDVPLYVQNRFGDFYQAMFEAARAQQGKSTVFTEYAWDMGWCDPCAADPLSVSQLRSLGAHWLEPSDAPAGGAVDAFVTRLHVRYDAQTHPEDLRLFETGDRSNFQGRFVTRHTYAGDLRCLRAAEYRREVAARYLREARALAALTGWPMTEIWADMKANGQDAEAIKIDVPRLGPLKRP